MTATPANWLGTTLHLFCQQVFSIKYIMYCLCSSVLTLKKDIRHIKIQLRKFGCNMETVSSCRLQNSSFEVREEWRPRLRTLTVTGYAVYSTDILLQHAMAQWPFHSPFTRTTWVNQTWSNPYWDTVHTNRNGLSEGARFNSQAGQ